MALYLRVQGDGVEPVGEACQVQVAAVVGTPGPQGPEGPQGPAGPGALRVYDATGSEVGLLANASNDCFVRSLGVFLPAIQAVAEFGPVDGGGTPTGLVCLDESIYFAEDDCAGQPIADPASRAARLVRFQFANQASRYFVTGVANQSVTIESRLSYADGCQDDFAQVSTLPALEVSRDSLGLEFLPGSGDTVSGPLHVAPTPP